MPSLPVATPNDLASLAEALATHGVCLLPDFQDDDATRALRLQLQAMQATGNLQPAGTGKGAGHRSSGMTRGDSTHWIENGQGTATTAYLAALHAVRASMNRQLFLGMQEVEAHFACYPAGAGYKRHRDRFQGSNSRVLSLVTYLNDDWQDADGGALRLYLPEGTVDVLPQACMSVCFLSETEHEVLPATRERLSIAAWLRTG